MRRRITKSAVARLSADGLWLWDTEVRGFGVRRQKHVAVYVLKTRIDGRVRWLTIGPHGSPWTPESARREALRLLGAIHSGSDPATMREQRNREPTLSQVLDRYVRDYVNVRNRASTAIEAKRHIAKDIKPTLGQLKISALTRADIIGWHARFADRPYSGNRALAYLRKALSLASKDWGLRSDNPALGIAMFSEAKRERFFSVAELGRLGAALDHFEGVDAGLPGCVRAIRLLALTGMRLGEVLGLKWDWIDFDASCIRLPGGKTGARTIPLGAAALECLAGFERIGGYVCFGATHTEHLTKSAFYRFWYALSARAKVANGRPHDFRHTVGTVSAQTGANAFQVRDILGHKTLAMTGRYVERRPAFSDRR